MDLRLVHILNSYFSAHDVIEDPVVSYERFAQMLFVGLLLVLFVAVRGRRQAGSRKVAVAAGATTALALVAGMVISHLVDRSRPFVADPTGVHLFAKHVADAGFPSDHATASFAIATAVILRDRRLGSIVLVFAAVLAVGRVAMGVHYPSDVLAGAILGVSCGLLLWIAPARRLVDAFADRLAGIWDAGERRVFGVVRAARA